MSRPTDRRDAAMAGFTLIEVVVALSVVAISIVAIGSLVAANFKTTRALNERLALVDVTRAVLTGLPERARLVPGSTTGDFSGYKWRLEIKALTAEFGESPPSVPWTPQSLVLTVQSPTGATMRVDTARLHREARSAQ